MERTSQMANIDWGGLASGVLSGIGTGFLGPLGGIAGNAIGGLIGGLTGPSKNDLANEQAKKQASEMAALESQGRQALGMAPNANNIMPNNTGSPAIDGALGNIDMNQLIQLLFNKK